MSRTYRCRHLPRLPGTGAKLIESSVYHRFKDEDYPHRWMYRMGQVPRRTDVNAGAPVEHFGNHPWVRWYMVVKTKSWYKANGNRKIRRQLQNLLREWA